MEAWLIVIGAMVFLFALRAAIHRVVHLGVHSAQQYRRSRRGPKPPKTLFD